MLGVPDVLNRPYGVLSEHKFLSAGGNVPVGVGGLAELPPGDGLNPGRRRIDKPDDVVLYGGVRRLRWDAQALHRVLKSSHGVCGQFYSRFICHGVASILRGEARATRPRPLFCRRSWERSLFSPWGLLPACSRRVSRSRGDSVLP
ncbi:hypothetical protein 2209_scaffold2350_00029 [Bacteriophage sp.]|nr:hypothetical protein 2209_scaffold2350_00029 [Bacteriophage sp.]